MSRLSGRTLSIAVIAMAIAVEIPTPAQNVGKPVRPGNRQNSSGTLTNAPAIPAFGLTGYLASPRGEVLLRHSQHPMLRALAQRLGLPVDAQTWAPSQISGSTSVTAQPDAVTPGCGGAA